MLTTIFYPFYKWLVVVPFVAVYTVVMFVLLLPVCWFDPELASRTIARAWGRGNYWITPAALTVRGSENIAPGQGYIVVANHLSQYDILVLYGWLMLDFKWVIKKELRSMPCIGAAGQLMGHVFLDRRDRAAAIRSLQEVKARLKPGTSIVFFAEGTRSRDGRLQAFKKGAFATARDLQLPILPVSLIGTDDILPPDGFRLRPGRAEMVVHPPIALSEVNALSTEQLRDRVRAVIAAVLPRERGAASVSSDQARVRCSQE